VRETTLTVIVVFLVGVLLIFLVEKTSTRKTEEGHVRPHVIYCITGVLGIIFAITIFLLPSSGHNTPFYILLIFSALAGALCIYTYFACSIDVSPDSISITSLFRKRTEVAIEDILRLKEVGSFRLLIIETRNTGNYYFPTDAYNMREFLAMMQREHPEVLVH